jgi:hypothetical protein
MGFGVRVSGGEVAHGKDMDEGLSKCLKMGLELFVARSRYRLLLTTILIQLYIICSLPYVADSVFIVPSHKSQQVFVEKG